MQSASLLMGFYLEMSRKCTVSARNEQYVPQLSSETYVMLLFRLCHTLGKQAPVSHRGNPVEVDN